MGTTRCAKPLPKGQFFFLHTTSFFRTLVLFSVTNYLFLELGPTGSVLRSV